MKQGALRLVCVALLVGFALSADYPYPVSVRPLSMFPSGTIGNGTIYSQTVDYFSFGNVVNPITVSITYSSGANYPASLCFNPNQQELSVTGTNLESICPAGAFGIVSNQTMLNGTQFENTPDGASSNSVSVQLYLRPTPNAGFVVTLPDAEETQDFFVSFMAEQCESEDLFPVGSNSQCIPIPDMDQRNGQMVTVGAGSWAYLRLSFEAFDSTVANNFTISMNGTDDGMSLYVQAGYVPTAAWFLETDDDTSQDNTVMATILMPGTMEAGQVYYAGIYNDGEETRQVWVNGTYGVCSASTVFGYNCQNSLSNTTDPAAGLRVVPSVITLGVNNSLTANNGSALSYDYSDDAYEHGYAYFAISEYPAYALPYAIRVTVGNNDASSLDGAPPIFAQLGGYPSAQSTQYNISTVGDVAHQLVLPVNDMVYNNGVMEDRYTWYIAVQLPVDFSIWVGANCANNCTNGEHGFCYCNTQDCNLITNNMTNFEPFYQVPTSLVDSAGACECDNDRYAFSFDCSEKNSGNSVLYILLIAIGGAIVLTIAIVVPLYCGIANKKANNYDKI